MIKALILIAGLSLPSYAGQLSSNYPGLSFLVHMNEGSGAVAYNSVSTNNGTTHFTAWVSGRFGSGLSFVTTDASLPFASYTGIPVGTLPRSYMFWIRRTSLAAMVTDSQWLEFSGNDGVANGVFGLKINATTNLFTFQDQSLNLFYSTAVINDMNWHLVGVTYSSSKIIRMYKDGVLSGSISKPNINTGTAKAFTIGDYWRSGPSYNFVGVIDEFAIFNRALPTGEIQRIYTEGLGRHSNAR